LSCPAKPTKPTIPIPDHLQKGSVFWFDLEDSIDPRISSKKARMYTVINRYSHNSPRIIISPITDRIHCVENNSNKLKYPSNAPLYKCDNLFLDKDSAVLLDQVYTIAKVELCEEWYVGLINDISVIDKAIMYNYDLFKSIEDTFAQLIKEYSKGYISHYSRK
jgi:mRNA-degrading endonuclease toxin of MazEF toxin-antitoxin module